VGSIPVLAMAAEWARNRLVLLRRQLAAAPVPGGAQTPVCGAMDQGGRGAASGHSIRSRRWIGAGLSVFGVILVAGFSIAGGAGGKIGLAFSGNVPGCLYMTGAALSWVAYCFLTEPLFVRRSRIYIVFWQNFFGFLGFLPFAALEYPQWGRPDPPVLLHTAFLGIGCSALGYCLYARALDVLGVGVSSVFINLIPVVTVTAGFFLLGDRLGPLQWAGAALVISGVYLTVLERWRGH
jgi:drug/metabolite transporter (DMT)-like permease